MKVTINAVKFRPDQKLEDFVNDKVSKLERQAAGLLGAEVTLKVDKPESENNKIAEIIYEKNKRQSNTVCQSPYEYDLPFAPPFLSYTAIYTNGI